MPLPRGVEAGGAILQVRVHGRGGQGVAIAAEVLSVAAFVDRDLGKPHRLAGSAAALAWQVFAGTLG